MLENEIGVQFGCERMVKPREKELGSSVFIPYQVGVDSQWAKHGVTFETLPQVAEDVPFIKEALNLHLVVQLMHGYHFQSVKVIRN